MKNKNLALVAVLFTISVIMAFANGPTPQVVIDTDQIIDGAVDIIKTTGIADTSLSNVVPATGRAALELGTMAVATATDYVATDTFTGHTDATGASVHGLGTIATVDSPVPIANGGTGATSATLALANLGTQPWTAGEKTQALVGSSTVGLIGKSFTSPTTTASYISGTRTMLIPSTIDTGITEITEFGAVDYLSNGILSVNTATFGKGAVFTLSQNITAKLAGHASFTATKNTAASINIYVEDGKLYVQNNNGSTMTGVITFTGLVKQ